MATQIFLSLVLPGEICFNLTCAYFFRWVELKNHPIVGLFFKWVGSSSGARKVPGSCLFFGWKEIGCKEGSCSTDVFFFFPPKVLTTRNAPLYDNPSSAKGLSAKR